MSQAIISAASAAAWAGRSLVDNTVTEIGNLIVLNNNIGADVDVAGISDSQQFGGTRKVVNRGANAIFLKAQDSAALAADRFTADAEIPAGGQVDLFYNGTRWEVFAAEGSGGGMSADTYDPQGIQSDAFDRANHTGTQDGSSVSGLLLEQVTDVTAPVADVNAVCDLAAYIDTETGNSSIHPAKPFTKLECAGGASYNMTLAAPDPSMYGRIKVIQMTADDGDVLVPLTNCVGQSSGTGATFNSVGDTLILVGAVGFWVVIKEVGVVLA
jgi:hypothetical protein